MESSLAPKPTIKVTAKHGLIRSAIDITNQSIDDMSIQFIDISSLPMLNTDLELNDSSHQKLKLFAKPFSNPIASYLLLRSTITLLTRL